MTDCAICGPAGPMLNTVDGQFTTLHREIHNLRSLLADMACNALAALVRGIVRAAT